MGLPMIHAKDFSARSLPIVSVPSGAGSRSTTGISSDSSTALYRGGHAAVSSTLVRKLDEDEATTDQSQTPKSASSDDRQHQVARAGGNEVYIPSSGVKEFPVGIVRELTKKEKKKKAKYASKYAKTLKSRNHTNIRRKVMHACFGLGFAAMNHLIPRAKFVPGMAILTGATLLMELLRYRKHFAWMNDALHFILGSSLRKHEMEGKFTGSFYFFLGVTVTSALFPTSCATLGICQLALADPSASYFGKMTRDIYWSRIENGLGGFGRNKGILGFIGGGLFCFPFNYRVLKLAKFGANGVPGGNAALVVASLALGMAGAFADLAVPTPALTLPKKVCGVRVPPFHLDDNFVVPIVSGYACTKVFSALGWCSNLELARYIIF